MVIIVVQMLLPEALSIGPTWMLPAVELVVLISLVMVNPSKLNKESRDLRLISVSMIAVISLANALALGLLLHELLNSRSQLAGRTLLYAAVGIWTMNAIAFGIWYWEIDRGGPIRRCLPSHSAPDFMFVQMENPGVCDTAWYPRFFDYLYLSITNSTAFSPTDTLPLTTRAKALMAAQSVTSLATIAVVGARAVNILR
jgi:uncharacterized membrane protein